MSPLLCSIDDIETLAGKWQGWLVTDRGFNLITFEIHADGSFEVSGPWVRYRGSLHPISDAG